MKKKFIQIPVESIVDHSFHKNTYSTLPDDYIGHSIKKTGNTPIYPIVVSRKSDNEYWLISGKARLDYLKSTSTKIVDALQIEEFENLNIEELIFELNKQRVKSGLERKNEFQYVLNLHKSSNGSKGYNRYSLIGKELGISEEKAKEYVMLSNFFKGNYEIFINKFFDGILNINQLNHIKAAAKDCPDEFNQFSDYNEIIDSNLKYQRLKECIAHYNPKKNLDVIKHLLSDNINQSSYEAHIASLKNKKRRQKIHAADLTNESYRTQNSYIIKGNNRLVKLDNPFSESINCLIGSPPYGDLRTNSETINENETGHNMDGSEYGNHLAETYEKYIPHLANDASIYVVIDDYLINGEMACSLEYFVIEMLKRGFKLIQRYKWVKSNCVPVPHYSKNVANSLEMCYRFVLDKKTYYSNPDFLIETNKEVKLIGGVMNHSKDGTSIKGGKYIQGELKKPRNVFNNKDLEDIITSSVVNPDTFFKKENEFAHTSQYPSILAAYFILQSTNTTDKNVVCDIWNGVGNTMNAALLLNRKYIGVELENGYYNQTVRKAEYLENIKSELLQAA